MKPQLLIFDLDGTLIDSREDLATAVNLTRAHYGLGPLAVETVTRFIGEGVRVLVERALEGFPADLAEAVRLQKQFYREHLHDRSVLYPGVAEGIAALHDAGHWLAVATNKDQEACEKILDHYGLRRFMRSVMGGGSVRNLKPHPEMLVATMRKLAMAPADAWMVGDHVTDLQCARLAGVKSAFMSYGIGTPEGETPTLTFASFGEFVRAFVSEG